MSDDVITLSAIEGGMRSMYTRVFSAILDSSIWEEDLHVRCLWITMLIIADESRDGTVNLPIGRLAGRAGLTKEQTRNALEVLMQPDPDSDSPDEEGRRIVPLVPERPMRGWLLVNWKKYKEIANAEQRRAQVAENMRRYRARQSSDQPLSERDQPVIPTTASTTTKTTSKTKAGTARDLVEGFVVTDEVRVYARTHGQDADQLIHDWLDYYRSNGYRVGKNPVANPKACFYRWIRNQAGGFGAPARKGDARPSVPNEPPAATAAARLDDIRETGRMWRTRVRAHPASSWEPEWPPREDVERYVAYLEGLESLESAKTLDEFLSEMR